MSEENNFQMNIKLIFACSLKILCDCGRSKKFNQNCLKSVNKRKASRKSKKSVLFYIELNFSLKEVFLLLTGKRKTSEKGGNK